MWRLFDVTQISRIALLKMASSKVASCVVGVQGGKHTLPLPSQTCCRLRVCCCLKRRLWWSPDNHPVQSDATYVSGQVSAARINTSLDLEPDQA